MIKIFGLIWIIVFSLFSFNIFADEIPPIVDCSSCKHPSSKKNQSQVKNALIRKKDHLHIQSMQYNSNQRPTQTTHTIIDCKGCSHPKEKK